MTRDQQRRWSLLFFAAVTVAYLASRLVFIEADPAPWHVSHYSPCDEGNYLNIAFYFVERHAEAAAELKQWMLVDSRHHTNWLLNAVSAPGLVVFGRTLLGMRFGTVVLGLVTLLATVGVVAQVWPGDRTRERRMAMVLAAVYLLVDYGFFASNRIAEPTAARMAALMALMLWTIPRLERLSTSRRGMFVLALVTVASWQLAYMTNVFVVPAVLVPVLIVRWRASDGTRRAARARGLIETGIFWLVAFALVFGACVLVYRVMFGHSMLDEMAFERRLNADRMASGAATLVIRKMIAFVRLITVGNSFKLAPPLLIGWLVALAGLIWRSVRSRGADMAALVVASFSVFFLAETVFLDDYPERKLVLCVPLALVTIAAALARLEPLADPRVRKIAVAVFAVVGLFVVGHAGLNRQLVGWVGDSIAVSAVRWVGILALVAAFTFWLRGQNRHASYAAAAVYASCLIAQTTTSVDLGYANATFRDRDMMLDIAKTTGGEPLIGGANICVRAYQPGGTFLSAYGFYFHPEVYRKMLDEAIAETHAKYHFTFEDDHCELFCLSADERRARGMRLVKTYSVPYFFGADKDMGFNDYALYAIDPVSPVP